MSWAAPATLPASAAGRCGQHRRRSEPVTAAADGSRLPPAAAVPPQAEPLAISRRGAVLAPLQTAAALAISWPVLADRAVAAEEGVLTVGAGQQYSTIGDALQAAPAGAVVEVHGGRYAERLVLTRPVTIRAAPDRAVEVVWETSSPYQATVECGPLDSETSSSSSGSGGSGSGGAPVVLQGLRIRHSSPSIANNYAVSLAGCNAALIDCDISSSTGAGVGIEGGAPTLVGCSVHDCARHGVAVFGDLYGGGCSAVLQDCSLADNRLCGLLVRDGASPAVSRCVLSGNGEWGMRLQDAGGAYVGNTLWSNASGSVAYALLYPEVDTARMVVENKLDRPVHYLAPARK